MYLALPSEQDLDRRSRKARLSGFQYTGSRPTKTRFVSVASRDCQTSAGTHPVCRADGEAEGRAEPCAYTESYAAVGLEQQ